MSWHHPVKYPYPEWQFLNCEVLYENDGDLALCNLAQLVWELRFVYEECRLFVYRNDPNGQLLGHRLLNKSKLQYIFVYLV